MRYVSIEQTIRYSIYTISEIACGPSFGLFWSAGIPTMYEVPVPCLKLKVTLLECVTDITNSLLIIIIIFQLKAIFQMWFNIIGYSNGEHSSYTMDISMPGWQDIRNYHQMVCTHETLTLLIFQSFLDIFLSIPIPFTIWKWTLTQVYWFCVSWHLSITGERVTDKDN